MKKNKIPKKYAKYNKWTITQLQEYVLKNYAYRLRYVDMKYSVYNYFGKCVLTCDSPDMIIYWLDIFK